MTTKKAKKKPTKKVKKMPEIDPESIPVSTDPNVWNGDDSSVTHRDTCPEKHAECALYRWASPAGDSRGPALMHVERPPRFYIWEAASKGNGKLKWAWLKKYLPVQAEGNRNLKATLEGEADSQRQTDFKQALEAQYKAQRDNQLPPMPADVGIVGTGTGFKETPGVDLGEKIHPAESTGDTQVKVDKA